MSSDSSDATQTRDFLYVLLCGRKCRLRDWGLKADLCIFVSFLPRRKGLYCECWHFRNCTCFYIWFVSVCERDRVAQLYHVGVYILFFFFFLHTFLGVCLWLASEASLQSIRNVCTGRSVIHALYSHFNFWRGFFMYGCYFWGAHWGGSSCWVCVSIFLFYFKLSV